MTKFKRIGILGGSFNPIHLGHLILAEQTRQIFHLEKVIFVPANLPPHKRTRVLVSAKERYHMVTLAVESNLSFEVSDLEIKRGDVSYSVETARVLKSTFPRTDLYFIVGSDFLKEFSMWKDVSEINKISKFVIVQRPGHPFTRPLHGKRAGFRRLPRKVQSININALDISSTDIRKRLRNRQSIRYLVPEEVRKYILKKGLYRKNKIVARCSNL